MASDAIVQSHSLPNPFTPLAFIEPALAAQLANGTYLHSGILAVLIWDDLHNIRNDYLLVTKHRVGLATFAYFLAKITALGYCLGRAFLITLPVENCKTLELAIDSLLTVCVSLDSILFCIRVCAMYYNKRHIVIFFVLCCLATIGTACLIPPSISTIHIGPTQHCIATLTRSLLPTYLTFLTFETLVFLATSYRLYFLYREEDTPFQTGLKIAFLGRSMPAFSKTMLHESQVYYLAVSLATVPTIFGSIFIKSHGGEIAITNLVVVHAMLGNILTCRVYRNTRLGLVRDAPEYDSLPRNRNIESGSNAPAKRLEFRLSADVVQHGAATPSHEDRGQKTINLLDIHKDTTTITVVDYPSLDDHSINIIEVDSH